MPSTSEARARARDAINGAVTSAAQGRVPEGDPTLGELARELELRAWALLDPGNLRATKPHAPVLVARTEHSPERPA